MPKCITKYINPFYLLVTYKKEDTSVSIEFEESRIS